MPCIGIDCRFASHHAGLGTYTRSIVRALALRADPWSYVLFVRSLNESWLQDLNRDCVTIVEAPFPHYSFAEQWRFPGLIRRSGCDLFYAPHFNVPFRCAVPFVSTIHDLILHRFPGEASIIKRFAYRFVIGNTIRNASRLITVSHFTAREIGYFYGEAFKERTSVIYPGVSPVFAPRSTEDQKNVRQRFHLTKPFLLYVGGSKQHKNLPVLLDAFDAAGLTDVDLVLVTQKGVDVRGQSNVRILDVVSESDLAALYSSALGSVTATLAEGFYLPALEAMACGCPVLATNAGAIPEVFGGMAMIVEPTTGALADGMRIIATDPLIRSADAHSLCIGFAKDFSWERTAEQTAGVMVKLLNC